MMSQPAIQGHIYNQTTEREMLDSRKSELSHDHQ
jgi:hypothetical protein